MMVTSAGAFASARAASNPPKPAPMITTFLRGSELKSRSEKLHRLFLLNFRPPQMFIEARQNFHEIAGPVAKIELVHENFVPGIAAGAGRAGKAKNKGRIGGARGSAALDRRRADLAERNLMEGDGKSVHALFEQRLDRFRRDVPPGEAGAAGGDHDVDFLIPDPRLYLGADRFYVVLHQRARGEFVARALDTPLQERPGFVSRKIARVGNGQHRDRERHEGLFGIEAGHGLLIALHSARCITRASTAPSFGCPKASESRSTISKPMLCHSFTARAFVATTKLKRMAEKPRSFACASECAHIARAIPRPKAAGAVM